jgi:hypothetical protein
VASQARFHFSHRALQVFPHRLQPASEAGVRSRQICEHGSQSCNELGIGYCLLRIGVDEAMAVTTAMAIGCVTQLAHDGGSAAGPLARSMRAALMSELTGYSPQHDDADRASRLLLARLGSVSGLLPPPKKHCCVSGCTPSPHTSSQRRATSTEASRCRNSDKTHKEKDEKNDQCHRRGVRRLPLAGRAGPSAPTRIRCHAAGRPGSDRAARRCDRRDRGPAPSRRPGGPILRHCQRLRSAHRQPDHRAGTQPLRRRHRDREQGRGMARPSRRLADRHPAGNGADPGRGCVARHARQCQSAHLPAAGGRQPGAGERTC